MKLTKNQTRILAVAAILLVAFNVITLIPPFFQKNGIFWLAWAFGNVAILMQLAVVKLAFPAGESARSKFYGFPIVRVGLIYLVIQLILSIVFMALAPVCPMWVPVVLFILLLAAALIGVIATDATREEVVRQDVQLKKDVNKMRGFQSLGNSLASQCADGEAGAEIKKLADQLRFSDPVSSDATAEIENELSALLEEIQRAVTEGDQPGATGLAKKAQAVLAERNRLCKLNK